MKRKAVILGIVQSFVAIGAIPAGLMMVLKPEMGVGMSTEILSGSPFEDFLIPGLFLLIVNGVFNVLGAVLSFAGSRYSGILGLILGIVLILWICIQVYFIGLSHFLQPLYLVVGILEAYFGYRLRKSLRYNKQ